MTESWNTSPPQVSITTGPPSSAVQQYQTSLNASPPAHPMESGELVAAVVSNANVPNPEIGSGVSHESFACAKALPAETIVARNVIPMCIFFIALPPVAARNCAVKLESTTPPVRVKRTACGTG